MIKRSALVFATVLAATTSQALALCMDGPPYSCVINGKEGTRQCSGGHITPCIPDEGGGSGGSASGTLYPKYYVLTVLYAPPGTQSDTQGGKTTSVVTYGAGSTTGTIISASKSFKNMHSVTATAGASFGIGAEVGVSFGVTDSGSNGSSLAITKSKTTTIQDAGPASDGIDHDHDLIYLWLNPSIDVTVNSASSSASWTIGSGTADIQYVYVGWLKHPAQMPPGVADRMHHYALTTQDYADILKQDPYANASPAITKRYQLQNTSFPYEPPYSANDPVPTYSFALSNGTTATTTSAVEKDYQVGLTVKAGVNFIVKASLESDNTWQWGASSSKANSNAATETATVTVGGPAFGYKGPTDIAVYFDRIYRSFLFVPVTGSAAFKGKVTNPGGQPAAWQEVNVTANGTRYRTFTDAKGNYRVFGKISGPVTIRAGGVTRTLPRIESSRSVDIELK